MRRATPIRLEEVEPRFRLWLEYRGKSILGKGGADILKVLEKYGSIEKAAKETPYSYRFIWGYLEKLNKRVGRPVVRTYRGGFKGGGGVELTEVGKALLARYKSLEKRINGAIKEATR
jgi:molybdate transport system regulatory protein